MRALAEAYRFLKLLIVLVVLALLTFIVSEMMTLGRAVMRPAWVVSDWVGFTKSPQVTVKQMRAEVPEKQRKCIAYALLADFVGAARQLHVDQERIARTLINYSETQGVDPCVVFERQMELVPPGWGKRKMSLGLMDASVPDRMIGYIERTFSEDARHRAILIVQHVYDHPDPSWRAIVLVRPDRPYTFGNQKKDEIDAIHTSLSEVRMSGASNFKFFAPME